MISKETPKRKKKNKRRQRSKKKVSGWGERKQKRVIERRGKRERNIQWKVKR